MADGYNQNVSRNDNLARTLAIIGIVLALLALGWAIKADNTANDAANKAESSQQSQDTIPATSNDNFGEHREESTVEDDSTVEDNSTDNNTMPETDRNTEMQQMR